MIIKKLNTVFHKHSRVLFGAFTLIIIVSFMGFLTPGQFGCDRGGAAMSVGKVYGKDVSIEELQNFARKNSVLMQREMDTRQLLFLYAMDVRAGQLGLAVSDDEVSKKIGSIFIGPDGKFDGKMYRERLEYAKKQGFTEDDFAEAIRLEAYLLSQVVVTPAEAERVYRDFNTKYDFATASFTAKSVKAPTEAELLKALEADRDRFRRVRIAEFAVKGGDDKAALKKASDFRRTIRNAKTPAERETAFRNAAKNGVVVQAPKWVCSDDADSDPLAARIFTATTRNSLTEPVAVDNGKQGKKIRIAYWMSGEKVGLPAVRKTIEREYMLAAARKLAQEESARLNKIADAKAREKAFRAMKQVAAFKEHKNESAPFIGIRTGHTVPDLTSAGAVIYLLRKRIPPTKPMGENEKAMFTGLCRQMKLQAAVRAFEEDIMNNCRFPQEPEGQR